MFVIAWRSCSWIPSQMMPERGSVPTCPPIAKIFPRRIACECGRVPRGDGNPRVGVGVAGVIGAGINAVDRDTAGHEVDGEAGCELMQRPLGGDVEQLTRQAE